MVLQPYPPTGELMARPKKQNWERELRRYALAGNLRAAERTLRHHLETNPNDESALAELQRLKNGEPLHATETTAQRKAREVTEACQALMNIMRAYPENILPTKTTARIRDLQNRIKSHTQVLKAAKAEEIPAVAAYRKLLADELRRRGIGRLRRSSRWIAAGLLAAGLVGAAFIVCQQRADKLCNDLNEALKATQMERVQTILKVADTGFNRALCSELEDSIRNANLWLTTTRTRQDWIEKHILRVESGATSVSGMRMSLRAEIERELQAMPTDCPGLEERWLRLCNREKAQLEYQKATITEALLSPLPDVPAFTGEPETDAAALAEQLKLIEQRQTLFDDTPKSYALSEDLLSLTNKRRDYITSCMKEIAGYRRLVEKFAKIRTYQHHRKLLEEYTPVHYTPAVQLMHIRTKLPQVENVKSLIQDPQRKIDDNEMKAAIVTLLDGGPTFTQAYPANRRQVHLMEDLFTAPSLHRQLLELSNEKGTICYTEEEPRIDHIRRVHFRRSDLDPNVTAQNKDVCWDDATSVWKITIDATPLVSTARLDKPTFFSERQLPELLTAVLNFERRQCPALAQACVYHKLLKLIKEHDHPLLTGINHSPSLRKHLSSFEQLVSRTGIELRPGCWLGKTQAQINAEIAFKRWFDQNRGADYCREIKQNFGALVRVGAAYCGYVNEKGQAAIFRELPAGTTIWYMTVEGIVAGQTGSELEAPTIFSPIFTAEKQRH